VCTTHHGVAVILLQQERNDVEERLVVLGDENPELRGQLFLLLLAFRSERTRVPQRPTRTG
jgi:hypothetical protein